MDCLCSCFQVPEVEENVESNHGICIWLSCLPNTLKNKYGAFFGRVHASPSHGQQTAASTSSTVAPTSKKIPSKVHFKSLPEEVHFNSLQEEEDVCPICLEEFIPDNPKKTTECRHDYHLQCIYQWQEKSNKCPLCEKVMVCEGLT